VGTRLQSHYGKRRNISLARLRYWIPLKVVRCARKNWIQGRSRTDDNRQLVTSNSDITRVIKNAKDLVTKEKVGKFKQQRQKDQLSAALKTEEHQGRT
jgi:hypothetical protein